MKPHIFSEIVGRLTITAQAFHSTEQLRERLAGVLDEFIPIEHNSTGAAELLPCPCCGGAPKFGVDSEDGGEYIECSNQSCRITTPLRFACMGPVKPLLSEIWNRRCRTENV